MIKKELNNEWHEFKKIQDFKKKNFYFGIWMRCFSEILNKTTIEYPEEKQREQNEIVLYLKIQMLYNNKNRNEHVLFMRTLY